jgi:hypothetical protein
MPRRKKVPHIERDDDARVIRQYSLYVAPTGEEISFRILPELRHFSDGGSWFAVSDYASKLPAQLVTVLHLEDGSLVEESEVETKGNPDRQSPVGTGWQVHNADSDAVTVFRRPRPPGERPVYVGPSDWLEHPSRRRRGDK